jgi:predicted GNAT family N-acyltransferase
MTNQTMPPSTKKQYTFTTSLYPPQILAPSTQNRTTLIYPTPLNPYPATNDPIFTHAMHIRDSVFVQEQLCRAEEEIDDDDGRSWGWVVYAHHHPEQNQGDGGEAVGTIRLVPPPHLRHSHLTSAAGEEETGGKKKKEYDIQHEPYIRITRVAVLAAFRGYGLSRLLMRTVEDWAARNKRVIDEMYSQFTAQEDGLDAAAQRWNGLIGLHAQAQVERMYASMGYETDESMGRWDEEGIEHVGMFKRVDII